jgi:hypothetical protein
MSGPFTLHIEVVTLAWACVHLVLPCCRASKWQDKVATKDPPSAKQLQTGERVNITPPDLEDDADLVLVNSDEEDAGRTLFVSTQDQSQLFGADSQSLPIAPSASQVQFSFNSSNKSTCNGNFLARVLQHACFVGSCALLPAQADPPRPPPSQSKHRMGLFSFMHQRPLEDPQVQSLQHELPF